MASLEAARNQEIEQAPASILSKYKKIPDRSSFVEEASVLAKAFLASSKSHRALSH